MVNLVVQTDVMKLSLIGSSSSGGSRGSRQLCWDVPFGMKGRDVVLLQLEDAEKDIGCLRQHLSSLSNSQRKRLDEAR